MYTQTSISVNLPSNEYAGATKPLFTTRRLTFTNVWNAILTKCGLELQRTYYVSTEEAAGRAEQMASSLTVLYAKKQNWSSNDTVRLKRDSVYHDDGTFQKLVDAGVFIEAFGHGANPLIKSNKTYVEIKNTAWF